MKRDPLKREWRMANRPVSRGLREVLPRALPRVLPGIFGSLAVGLMSVVGVWSGAWASEDIPPPAQKAPLLITGATVHPMSGPAVPNARLLIEGGRIKALAGVQQTLPPLPPGTQTLELNGRHIYPGFIAANSGLGLTEVGAVRATVDMSEVGAINPNARAVVAVNPDSELLPVARSNGVLAALAVPSNEQGALFTGTSALVQMDGWTWEDMAIAPAMGVHLVLPSLRPPRMDDSPAAQSLQKNWQELTRKRLQQIEDALDAAAAYGRARAAQADTPKDLRWEALQSTLRRERPLFVHANELAQIRFALSLAERYALRLILVGGADAWRVADILKQRQVSVIIGGVHPLPLRRDDAFDSRFSLAARLHTAGVRYCIARQGDGFGAAHERNLPYEAAQAVAFGLPREEALKAITLYPAQILGVDDRLGSLQPGRLANFIVTGGDPLEVVTPIERIFIQGREISTANRQTRLAEKYRQKYEQQGRLKGQ
jgi:imidazolonepropionase-like amidohydrolase